MAKEVLIDRTLNCDAFIDELDSLKDRKVGYLKLKVFSGLEKEIPEYEFMLRDEEFTEAEFLRIKLFSRGRTDWVFCLLYSSNPRYDYKPMEIPETYNEISASDNVGFLLGQICDHFDVSPDDLASDMRIDLEEYIKIIRGESDFLLEHAYGIVESYTLNGEFVRELVSLATDTDE